MPRSKDRGDLGELWAAEDYQKDGYTLLHRNYRTRMGEIDLILKKDTYLVFAEVKTRASNAIAKPREWVDYRKQQKIILAANYYLLQHRLSDPFLRFDVVEVYIDNRTPETPAKIIRIENAFTP